MNFVLNSQLIKKLDVSWIDCLKLEMHQLFQFINLGHDALVSALQYVEFSIKQTNENDCLCGKVSNFFCCLTMVALNLLISTLGYIACFSIFCLHLMLCIMSSFGTGPFFAFPFDIDLNC